MSTGAPPLPATAPSAARTSGNSVVLQITRLNEELAYVRRELSEQREKVNTLEKSRDDTKRLMKAAVAQLNVQEKRNAELETALRLVVTAVGVNLPAGILDNNSPVAGALENGGEGTVAGGNGAPEMIPGPTEQSGVTVSSTTLSHEPKEHIIGKAARQSLFALYGCDHLRNYADLCYPGVEKTHPDWPKKGGTPLARFDFDSAYNSPVNNATFDEWVTYVKNHGATHLPEASQAISRASEAALRDQCKAKWKYFKQEFKRKKKEALTSLPGPATVLGVRQRDDDGEDGEDDPEEGNQQHSTGSDRIAHQTDSRAHERANNLLAGTMEGDASNPPNSEHHTSSSAPNNTIPPYPSTNKGEIRSRANGVSLPC